MKEWICGWKRRCRLQYPPGRIYEYTKRMHHYLGQIIPYLVPRNHISRFKCCTSAQGREDHRMIVVGVAHVTGIFVADRAPPGMRVTSADEWIQSSISISHHLQPSQASSRQDEVF